MRSLIVFTAVLALTLLGSAGIANADWDETGVGVITTSDDVGIGPYQTLLSFLEFAPLGGYGDPGRRDIITPYGWNYSKIFSIRNTGYAAPRWFGVGDAKLPALGFELTNDDGLTGPAALVIQRSGRVGIGTGYPMAALDVFGGDARIDIVNTYLAQNQHRYSIATTGDGLAFQSRMDNGDLASTVMVVGKESNVGIGVTDPLYKLEVNGKTSTLELRIAEPPECIDDFLLCWDPETQQVTLSDIPCADIGNGGGPPYDDTLIWAAVDANTGAINDVGGILDRLDDLEDKVNEIIAALNRPGASGISNRNFLNPLP